jgi:hypothetical protein
MEPSLAIAAYRCEIAGVPDDSIDIQVRYFESGSPEKIEAALRSEQVHSYPNSDGELVAWPFVRLLAVEPLTQPTNGAEVVGFITGCHEFVAWARNGT